MYLLNSNQKGHGRDQLTMHGISSVPHRIFEISYRLEKVVFEATRLLLVLRVMITALNTIDVAILVMFCVFIF